MSEGGGRSSFRSVVEAVVDEVVVVEDVDPLAAGALDAVVPGANETEDLRGAVESAAARDGVIDECFDIELCGVVVDDFDLHTIGAGVLGEETERIACVT